MTKDLIILTADKQQEFALRPVLQRTAALGIRSITFHIERHPGKDSGVYREADGYLNPFKPFYNHALVVLDAEWSGAPEDTVAMRDDILHRLVMRGWPEDQCEVVVIVPELEIWLWADSSEIPQALRTTWQEIHTIGQQRKLWTEGRGKPERPKELLEAVLEQQGRSSSSAILQQIASKVSLRRCQDPSFLLLRETLVRWFPANGR
jgi:hypothetical protein